MRLLPLIVVPLASARVVNSQHQVPIIEQFVDDVAPQVVHVENSLAYETPAIGVHFTTSYALAAARFPNGMTKELVKVNGDAEYIELVRRWMGIRQESWEDECDRVARIAPGRAMSARSNCNWRRISRGVRRTLGLAASRDIAVLSSFLHSLRSSIAESLGGMDITHIAPATFPLSRAQTQDFGEALDLAGFTSTDQWGFYGTLYQDVNAAYAGLGHGLCKLPSSSESMCLQEQNRGPIEEVLFLNFDNSSFVGTVQRMQSAYMNWGMYDYAFSPNHGWWDLPVHEVPRAKFWANIHELIVEAASVLSTPPKKVVLLGEHGGDAEFREVVEEALWSLFEYDVSVILDDNDMEGVAGVAAKGAAEFAWRSKIEWIEENWKKETTEEAVIDL